MHPSSTYQGEVSTVPPKWMLSSSNVGKEAAWKEMVKDIDSITWPEC